MYSDVHDQQDFTKYCQVFLTQLQELDKNSLIPNHPPPILKNGENHSSILCMMSQPLLLRLVFGLMPLHRLFTTSHWVPQSWCQIFFDYQWIVELLCSTRQWTSSIRSKCFTPRKETAMNKNWHRRHTWPVSCSTYTNTEEPSTSNTASETHPYYQGLPANRWRRTGSERAERNVYAIYISKSG